MGGPGARLPVCVLQMTGHNPYLFSRNGAHPHYSERHREKQAGTPEEEEIKRMCGMLFSTRSFVSRLPPLPGKDGCLAFQTDSLTRRRPRGSRLLWMLTRHGARPRSATSLLRHSRYTEPGGGAPVPTGTRWAE